MKDLKELATGLTLALIILVIVGYMLVTNGDLNSADGFYGILAVVCVAGLIGYKDKKR